MHRRAIPADMASPDVMSDSSVDEDAPTPICILDKDSLGQIARLLKPSDVLSLSYTFKDFSS